MGSKTTLRLNKPLCERARDAAAAAGYSSLEEFVEHAIEKQLGVTEKKETKEELVRRLKGLGYLK